MYERHGATNAMINGMHLRRLTYYSYIDTPYQYRVSVLCTEVSPESNAKENAGTSHVGCHAVSSLSQRYAYDHPLSWGKLSSSQILDACLLRERVEGQADFNSVPITLYRVLR